MSDKLGFTFYPKDWWTSDTYFDFTPSERYIYLECMFIMYSNDGYMKTQKTQFENRTRIFPTDEEWQNVTSKFILDDKGYTMLSVNKRLRKATANKENGKLGGRPKADKPTEEKPKEPKKITQNNPPLEREREREIEYKLNEIQQNLMESILVFFDYTNDNFHKQKSDVLAFVLSLPFHGKLDFVNVQFPFYKKLKSADGYKHSLESFLGKQAEQWQGGKWNDNWEGKWKDYQQKNGGVTTAPKGGTILSREKQRRANGQ